MLAESTDAVTVRHAAEVLRELYQRRHVQRAESVLLRPRGYTVATFQQVGRQQLGEQIFGELLKEFMLFGLNAVDFLICGADPSGAHIFRVFYSGIAGGDWLEWSNHLGFRAIGSGTGHAVARLSIEGQEAGLSARETLFNVYRAKKTAESVNDVGTGTDVWIVRKGQSVELGPAAMERLDAVWAAHEEAQRIVPGLDTLFDGTQEEEPQADERHEEPA